MEWVATGRVFDAQEALEGGLVRSVHPAGELLDAARALAGEIAENTAPVSVALARQMMWRMLGAEHPMLAHRADSRGMYYRGRSADAAEGITSFLEKRPAAVRGPGQRRAAGRHARLELARVQLKHPSRYRSGRCGSWSSTTTTASPTTSSSTWASSAPRSRSCATTTRPSTSCWSAATTG